MDEFSHLDKMVYGNRNLEDDDDLMAELLALQQEEDQKLRKNAPVPTMKAPAPPGRQGGPSAGIDPSIMAAALADHHDDDIEPDEDLLGELNDLIGESGSAEPSLPAQNTAPPVVLAPPVPPRKASTTSSESNRLRQLLTIYEKMKEASVKENNSAKTRRMQRSTDKLRELIGKADRGLKIDQSEVPPAPPGWEPSSSEPELAAPVPQSTPVAPPTHPQPITEQRSRSSPPTIPPPVPTAGPGIDSAPSSISTQKNVTSKKEEIKQILTKRKMAFIANAKAALAASDQKACMSNGEMAKNFDQAIAELEAASEEDAAAMDLSEIPPSPPPYRKREAPVAPKTFIDGLEQRMGRYLAMAEDAKKSGVDRKVRMNERLAGQYKDAIVLARAGKQVNVAELPSLPDMPPLPAQTAGVLKAAPKPTMNAPGPSAEAPSTSAQAPASTALQFLLERQHQFKQAAVHAKSQGNMEMAKKYLLESKGFDKMITAARQGLPVSIKNCPVPPQMTTSTAALQPKIVPSGTSITGVEGRGEVLALLEKKLIEQVQLAENNRMRFTRLGEVGKVKLFETWAQSSRQDLLLVRAVAKEGLKIPRFHYENRVIPTADLFPDLAEDALEISILGCKDVPLPSGYEPQHANLFVRYVFPFPQETPQTGKTKYVAGSTSPQFNEAIVVQIGTRKARGQRLMRILKRSPLKLELYQKGSFLRSDKLLGTAEIKLDVLETKAEVEESLPLKDGRRAVGGLLYLRIRIREPLGDTKAQSTTHKWIVLDN